MKNIETFIALNRFGLGPAPGEAKRAEDDPRGWVKAQIKSSQRTPKLLARFRGSAAIIKDMALDRNNDPKSTKKRGEIYRKEFLAEMLQRAEHAVQTETPFAERMVMFWSNHFTVSSDKKFIAPAIPAYEREAIRPHIFGKFSDMLKAVIGHPVMLAFLDNHLSKGPRSPMGIRQIIRSGVRTTLNENLAREILELHTLGVDGGYDQDDVLELAKAISGWSHGAIRLPHDDSPPSGRFEFNKYMHEPGRKKILGKTYREKGVKTGLEVLNDLARHPSTARHIATKLVRHFVADDPPQDAVDKITSVFKQTNGDLAKVSYALIDLEAVWANPLSKVKTHYELVISTFRAGGRKNIMPMALADPLREFGQMPFSAATPAGWPDEASQWISPESLMRRIEWLEKIAGDLPANTNPSRALDELLGPVVSDNTRLWVSRAPSVSAGLGLVLASPEFQRR